MRMNSDALRASLLVGCLLAGVFDAVAVHAMQLRLLLGLLLVVLAAIVLRLTRQAAAAPAEATASPGEAIAITGAETATPAAAKKPREKKPAKPFLPTRRPPLRKQVEVLTQVTAELSMKLAHHDGLRHAMWTTLDGRITDLETMQANELTSLREGRERHHAAVGQLQERVDAHKRALASLLEVLNPGQPAPARLLESQPVELQPADVAPLGTAATSF
jgi:hypothetical protein